MPCGMLAVMPNVPVKMPYMVTTDVLASMLTTNNKMHNSYQRERERESTLYPFSLKNAGDCRRGDDRMKEGFGMV